ncbi:hypothetical protein ACFFKE_32325 [Streptomyces mutabilis]|uniref:hypothetical protein n=1 Tax=Streptomyces mutabilis TaxID=67332 RepID=UPI00177EBDEB|nr:hypothetical protein [Streptomyces mutabilis]GGQ38477.1 hypothetical protein GCM10010279_54720 [Streptomyces mutabilis]
MDIERAEQLATEYADQAAQFAEVNTEHAVQRAQAYAATSQAYAAIAHTHYLANIAGAALRR